MRLLHVVPTYLPAVRYGGPIYSVHGLCKALAALGHEVHVFTTNIDGDADSAVPLGVPVDLDGVKVWYFPSTFGRRLYWSPAMARMLKRSVAGFDVVHLHSIFLWPTWQAARVASRYRIPYVLSPRGMLVKDLIERKSRWIKRAWIRLIETRNIERAALLHVTSTREAEDLAPFHFRVRAVAVVPNGVDPVAGYAAEDVSGDIATAIQAGPYVLFLGRLNWKKGLDRLIPAMRGIQGCRLLIVGNDEENYLAVLRGLIAQHGLSGSVHILPRFVTGPDKAALFGHAALFALPSYSENFGNTVTEAMASGCPVIVTPEVGAAELVAASGAGLVVRGDELGAQLGALLADPDRLAAMGHTGRHWIEDRLGWLTVAQTLAAHYAALPKNPRPNPESRPS